MTPPRHLGSMLSNLVERSTLDMTNLAILTKIEQACAVREVFFSISLQPILEFFRGSYATYALLVSCF